MDAFSKKNVNADPQRSRRRFLHVASRILPEGGAPSAMQLPHVLGAGHAGLGRSENASDPLARPCDDPMINSMETVISEPQLPGSDRISQPVQTSVSATKQSKKGMNFSMFKRLASQNLGLVIRVTIAGSAMALGGLALQACSGLDASSTLTGANGDAYNTTGVLCDYAYHAFNPTQTVQAISSASWNCDGGRRSVTANGLPDHPIGIFPNPGNMETLSAQRIRDSMPLLPVATGAITRKGGPRVLTGYLLNGIKIDPGTAGTCNDAGTHCPMGPSFGAWNIEAMGQSSFNYGTDESNAHVQPSGAYHYHGMPEAFIQKLNKGKSMTLIGWAADGFPIYARYGYAVANDANSGVKVVTGSYRTKAQPDANRPSTKVYAMGTFTQDYEYVAGLGDLDECNGRTGVTPEFPKGIYHYYATDTYPYLQRCVKGKL